MSRINNELRELLVSLKARDDELRKSILINGSLYEGYDEDMESLHIENAEKLNAIVDECGWPGKSLVGKDGVDAAVIIAQHSISKPNLQKRFLEFLKTAVLKGEALPVHEACLEDRILFNEGKPQKYGMLFEWNDQGELITNVDNTALANERRPGCGSTLSCCCFPLAFSGLWTCHGQYFMALPRGAFTTFRVRCLRISSPAAMSWQLACHSFFCHASGGWYSTGLIQAISPTQVL